MCFLPKLNQIKRNVRTISGFGGLNERASIADNEFSDCCNISPEEYPALGVRDGYEGYIASEMLGKMWVRSVRGNMITYHNGETTLTFFDQSTGNPRTETIVVADNIGFDLYNNELCFLLKPDEDGTFKLEFVKFKGMVTSGTTYVIPDTGIFDNYDEKSPVCFMAFGSRMIIAYKGEVAISYHDNISDWTTYKVDGHATEECAQRIHLLDDGNFGLHFK